MPFIKIIRFSAKKHRLSQLGRNLKKLRRSTRHYSNNSNLNKTITKQRRKLENSTGKEAIFRQNLANSKFSDSTYKWRVFLLFGCLLIGLSIGIAQAVSMDNAKLDDLKHQLDWQLGLSLSQAPQNAAGVENKPADYRSAALSQSSVFMDTVIKNGGSVLLIWLTAFIPLGGLAASVILFIRAMGYGFTLAVLLRAYSKIALFYIITSFGIQCLILLITLLLLCIASGRFGEQFKEKTKYFSRHLLTYLVALLIAEASVVLASMLY